MNEDSEKLFTTTEYLTAAWGPRDRFYPDPDILRKLEHARKKIHGFFHIQYLDHWNNNKPLPVPRIWPHADWEMDIQNWKRRQNLSDKISYVFKRACQEKEKLLSAFSHFPPEIALSLVEELYKNRQTEAIKAVYSEEIKFEKELEQEYEEQAKTLAAIDAGDK